MDFVTVNGVDSNWIFDDILRKQLAGRPTYNPDGMYDVTIVRGDFCVAKL